MDDLTHLIEAVKQGDLERVRALLNTNAELAKQLDESGATSLHYATLNGHRQIMRLLVERGAEINSIDRQSGATPAGWAIERVQSFLNRMMPHSLMQLVKLAGQQPGS